MIKKALAFALLLVVGFVVLNVAIEGDLLPGSATKAGRMTETVVPDSDSGVGVGGSERSDLNVRVVIEGPIDMPSYRELAQPDGSVRRLRVYELHAADSQPISADRFRLQDVRVDLFETRDGEEARTGELRATQAFVQIGRDAKGAPSIREDKDIELVDAVLETVAESRVKALRLEIDRALARWSAAGISLRTTTPDQGFRLVTLGESPLQLTGKGLDAALPRNQDSPAPIRVRVNADPELISTSARGRTVLRSRGALEYVETAGAGTAVVTTTDDVSIEGLQADGSGRPLRAFGDRLRASLHRAKGGDSSVLWRSLRLDGKPARLDLQGYLLSCERLDVSPSPTGLPYLFTASGSPELISEQSGDKLAFTAERRIHMVRLREHLAPLLAPFGFRDGGLGCATLELLIFEGRAVAKTGGLELRADDGLRVLGALREGGALSVVGRGAVSVTSDDPDDDLHVSGNNGLVLRRDAAGNEFLRLGPETSDPAHEFAVRRGDLDVSGHGSCSVRRRLDEAQRIELRSPNADVHLSLAGGHGGLQRVAELSATFDDTGLRTVDARGPALGIDWRDDQGGLSGTATRIVSTVRDVYELTGAPATLVRGAETVEGRKVIVARTGREARLQAIGEAHVRAAGSAEAGDLELFADDVRFVPSVVPAAVLDLYAPALVRYGMLAPTLRTRHVFAGGDVRVNTGSAKGADGQNHAEGTRLVLQLGGDGVGGRLDGAPATFARKGSTQDLSGAASVLRLQRSGGVESMTLVYADDRSPRVTLAQSDARFSRTGGAPQPIEVTCEGTIAAKRGTVTFAGPVHATALDADGDPDPEAFDLRAAGMRMDRDATTGAVTSVHAFGKADLTWRQLDIEAEHLWLDLLQHMCTVRDDGGAARFWFGDRVEWRGSLAEFDYVTMEIARVRPLLIRASGNRTGR